MRRIDKMCADLHVREIELSFEHLSNGPYVRLYCRLWPSKISLTKDGRERRRGLDIMASAKTLDDCERAFRERVYRAQLEANESRHDFGLPSVWPYLDTADDASSVSGGEGS